MFKLFSRLAILWFAFFALSSSADECASYDVVNMNQLHLALLDSSITKICVVDGTYDFTTYLDNGVTAQGYSINRNLIIEGQSRDNVIFIGTNTEATKFMRLFSLDNASITFTLTKLTLQKGKSPAGYDGGAIRSNYANLFIDTVNLIDNQSSRSGGAIYGKSSMTIKNAKFEGNKALDCDCNGGAISVSSYDGSENVTEVTIENSSFIGNEALNHGGALLLYSEEGHEINATIRNSTFEDNSAESGAAINVSDIAQLIIDQSIFISNYATLYAGAVGISNTDVIDITNTTFTSNEGSYGGALHFYNTDETSSLVNIQDATFNENKTFNISYANDGGAILINGNAIVSVKNSTFNHNQAVTGGAIYSYLGSMTTIDSSTFSGNSVFDEEGLGGAMYAYTYEEDFSTIEIRNSIIESTDELNNQCYNNIISADYNLTNDSSCSALFMAENDIYSTEDLGIGELADNGGSTETMDIAATSLGFDTGSCIAIDGSVIQTDQRGVNRPQYANCDRGSYELEEDSGNLLRNSYADQDLEYWTIYDNNSAQNPSTVEDDTGNSYFEIYPSTHLYQDYSFSAEQLSQIQADANGNGEADNVRLEVCGLMKPNETGKAEGNPYLMLYFLDANGKIAVPSLYQNGRYYYGLQSPVVKDTTAWDNGISICIADYKGNGSNSLAIPTTTTKIRVFMKVNSEDEDNSETHGIFDNVEAWLAKANESVEVATKIIKK